MATCSAGGLCIVLTVTVLQETRTGIMLTRKAKALRAETGDARYRARVEDTRGPLRSLLWISATRPLSASRCFLHLSTRLLAPRAVLLFTEPTVLFFSLWISFAWGIMYSMFECVSLSPAASDLHGANLSMSHRSILPVFEGIYGFNHGEAGLTFAGMTYVPLPSFPPSLASPPLSSLALHFTFIELLND
jgi:hypothetical protein